MAGNLSNYERNPSLIHDYIHRAHPMVYYWLKRIDKNDIFSVG